MAYTSHQIANHFIGRALREGSVVTPMKIIKLVYIAHGWHLALSNEPLIKEDIEAWQYGPVISVLYHNLKEFGNRAITHLSSVVNSATPTMMNFYEPSIPADDKRIINFSDRIYSVYEKYSGLQLSTLTHQAGSPWHETVKDKMVGGKVPPGLTIPNDLIKKHYSQKANP